MFDSQLAAQQKAQEAASKASAAADLKALQSSAFNEAWNMAGKTFADTQDRDKAANRLVELEAAGLISKESLEQTTATLSVKPPTPTHAEQRAAIEKQMAGEPQDAKNMSKELFDTMWDRIGKK
jgi:argininosuccinate lyase